MTHKSEDYKISAVKHSYYNCIIFTILYIIFSLNILVITKLYYESYENNIHIKFSNK